MSEEASEEPDMQLRDTNQRKADVLDKLRTEVDLWVASANATGDAYLIPLSLYWDGESLFVALPTQSRTARNLRRAGWARMALGPTRDVVIVEGPIEEIPVHGNDELATVHAGATGFDAREGPDEYVFMRLTPRRIQAWRSAAELTGRDVMLDGDWLA